VTYILVLEILPLFYLRRKQNPASIAKGTLDTERLLLWSRHFATRSSLAVAARNTFPRHKQTLRVFLTTVVYRVIVGSLVTVL
jgi:hypothetical protein